MHLVRDRAATVSALAEAEERHPALASVFALHRAIAEAQSRARVAAAHEGVDRRGRARLERGVPLLSFAELEIEPGAYAEVARLVTEALQAHLPGMPADIELGPEQWLEAAAEWFATGGPPAGGAETDAVSLVAAYALVPWLEARAAAVAPSDLASWQRPTCPVCGGCPDLAILAPPAGERTLVCSRCSCEWPFRRLGCAFCDSKDRTAVYHKGFDTGDRLYVCEACCSYVKTIDLRERAGPLVAAVERVRTVPLDLAAERHGYHPGCLQRHENGAVCPQSP